MYVALCRLAKVGKFRICVGQLIGAPWGSTYKLAVDGSRLLPVTEHEPVLGPAVDEIDKDNATLVDANQRNQGLTSQDIAAMAASGKAGEDIIAALCSNSATFEGKTEFAQEKYKRRKARKYTTSLSLRRPTSWGLCEVMFDKAPAGIWNLRPDSLSLLLSLANVAAHSRTLLLDNCQGLLAAACAERMGGHGVLCCVGTGGKAPALSGLRQLNLGQQQRAVVCMAQLTDVQQAAERLEARGEQQQQQQQQVQANGSSQEQPVPEKKPVAAAAEPAAAAPMAVDGEEDSATAAAGGVTVPAGVPVAAAAAVAAVHEDEVLALYDNIAEDGSAEQEQPKKKQRRSTGRHQQQQQQPDPQEAAAAAAAAAAGPADGNQPHQQQPQQQPGQPEQQAAAEAGTRGSYTASPEQLESLLGQGFNSCIIAAPRLHTASILKQVLPLLAPSTPFVVFSPWQQPLAEAMAQLTARKAALMLQLQESWMRPYQVLPGRTHPHMNMTTGGTGGYILSGTTVAPAGPEPSGGQEQGSAGSRGGGRGGRRGGKRGRR
ncbi:hypothetical protein OEZ86_006661 [Tetradesmus obliquus]|nr:hypothetical protein OEZ86_006661 [Tetradesmus obliquus]